MKSAIASNSTEFSNILKCFDLSPADKIGSGVFSAVYKHPSGVAKFTFDDLWVDYVKACGHLPASPSALHIARKVLLYRGRPMSFVLMPRYTAVKPNSKEGRYSRQLRLLRAQEQERLLKDAVDSRDPQWLAAPGSALLDRVARLAAANSDGLAYVAATLGGIAGFVRRHPQRNLINVDFHTGNFLFDPASGRLILSDPLVLTADPEADQQNTAHETNSWGAI